MLGLGGLLFPLLLETFGEAVMCLCIVRIKFDGSLESLDGHIDVAFFQLGQSSICGECGSLLVCPNLVKSRGLLKLGAGGFYVALLPHGVSECVLDLARCRRKLERIPKSRHARVT